jgi:hypothetical protein
MPQEVSVKLNRQIEAYMRMFTIENLLRVGMHNCLVKSKGANYFIESNFPEFDYNLDGNQIHIDTFKIVSVAKSKKSEEIKYKVKLGYEYSYLWYLDFMHLLMILDHFWTVYFLDMFNNPKNIKSDFIQRGINLSQIRNAIAHNRYVSDTEFQDLQNFYEIVRVAMKDEHLLNYEELVYNNLEQLRINFIKSSSQISKQIEKGQVITRGELRNWRILFSALQPIEIFPDRENLFSEVFNLINQYNNTLPRKPGSMNEINKFVKENKLIEKILLLIS